MIRKIDKTIFSFLLLAFTPTIHAGIPGYGLDRLFKVSEWNQLCAGLGVQEKVANCKAVLLRATINGRTVATFDLINPADQSLLQTRSGVLFQPRLNEMIVGVREDNGMRTTVRLEKDIQCQAYATTPDLVGIPSSDRSYQRLIKSWLGVYTDESSRIRTVTVGEHEGRRVLRFDALTNNNRVIRGTYWFDARANAAIFSTCDHPLASEEAHRNSELFFSSIVGSARRFI